MFIRKIETIPHFVGQGQVYDSLDPVADAIRKLGTRHDADPAAIELFITGMRSHLETRVQFAHNEHALTRSAPFPDHEIRVIKSQPFGTSALYSLIITDLPSHDGLPQNHSDALLRLELGQGVPVEHIVVSAHYDRPPTETDVTFQVAPVLQALLGIDGIEPVETTSEAVATAYYEHDRQYLHPHTAHELVIEHASGATITLCGFYGIRTHGGHSGVRELIKLDGSVISGPPDTYHRTPHVQFKVTPGPNTTPEQLTALAEALTTALQAIDH